MAAVKDVPGQGVTAFLQVAHALDFTAVRLARGDVHTGQDVAGLEDAPVVRDGLAELGEVPAAGQHPEDVVRGHGGGMDRGDHAQDVRPVRGDAVEVDAPAGGRVERAVVGGRVGAPE